MSLKPVWIVLAADRDLVAVARDRPDLARDVPGLEVVPGEGVSVTGPGDGQGDEAQRTMLIMHASSGDPGAIGWEADEVSELRRMRVYVHAHGVEARSASLTARLICALAPHCRLAVDNDFGGLMEAAGFCALGHEAQVAFIQAARSDEATAELDAVAGDAS